MSPRTYAIPSNIFDHDLILLDLGCVTLPEENDSHHGPYCAIFPMFTEDIGRVSVTTNMIKSCNTGRYGMASFVERESVVSLL